MNILFSSDDNYAKHLGVAMYSLMIHTPKAKKLNFFIVDNHISGANVAKLKQVVRDFSNSNIRFISFDTFAKELVLDMPWPISMSAYARLFAAEMLPKELDRILYLDCDMVINHDLSELWNIDLQGKCIGAVQDQVSPKIKESVGLSSKDRYFNSGLLLIDLRKWRTLNIGKQAIDFIRLHGGRVIHHDQGVLNGLLHDNGWLRLPLKYNVMTIHYMMDQHKIVRYFSDFSVFYSQEEVSVAKYYPCVIHFTPSFTSRPWEQNCKHPLRALYNIFLYRTLWSSSLDEERIPWYSRIINWRYRNLPI